MIKEQGRVVAVETDSIWVEVIQHSACHSCKAKAGCGQSVIGKMYDGRRQHLQVSTRSHRDKLFVVDQQVEIGIPEQALMQGVVWAYLVPLAGLFAGAVAGSAWLGGSDLAAITGAAVGFSGGLLLVKAWYSGSARHQQLQPELLA